MPENVIAALGLGVVMAVPFVVKCLRDRLNARTKA